MTWTRDGRWLVFFGNQTTTGRSPESGPIWLDFENQQPALFKETILEYEMIWAFENHRNEEKNITLGSSIDNITCQRAILVHMYK